MARRPSQRFGYIALGGTSGRYRDVETGETISNRKMSDIVREARLGEKTTKEQYTKGVVEKRYSYADAKTKLRQSHAAMSLEIRRELLAGNPGMRPGEIDPADVALAIKFREQGYDEMNDDEKRRFHRMFERYSSPSVREALGSPKRRRSSRRRSTPTRTRDMKRRPTRRQAKGRKRA
jgi:hypothetical protein